MTNHINGDDAFNVFVFNWNDSPHILKMFGGNDIAVDKSFAVDRIFGGLGNDTIAVEGGNAVIHGNQGDDIISVKSGQDGFAFDVRAKGGIGHDSLVVWNSDGYEMHTSHSGVTHIDLPDGEHIVARDIEEIQFI